MASSILHIKDSFYFEVPKVLLHSHRESRKDFPAFWTRLDEDYQLWEAGRQLDALAALKPGVAGESLSIADMPARGELFSQYKLWRSEHSNFAKPFDAFLETADSQEWFQSQLGGEVAQQQWRTIKEEAEDVEQYLSSTPEWSAEKILEYNHQLDGKILIPQPFGQIKNLYQGESGFTISKFMIIELVVAVVIAASFIWLAKRLRSGDRPQGKRQNMFEAVLLYFRDEIVRPVIGGKEADRFVPLLWTLFLFILGLNLAGMIPFVGAPTGSFGTTLGLAIVTFGTGLTFGMQKFGPIGFWTNQVPSMGLPWYMAIVIVPMIFAIEILGMFIKHAVLGVRLLANMVAGHLVLLAVMGLAVAAAGSSTWGLTASIAVVGSALFSCLELFVAFLQAYIFTFLSALFIGMAIHHH